MASHSSDEDSNNGDEKDHEDETSVDELTKQVEQLELKKKEDDVEASADIRTVADWIRKAKNILVLSGAGVSCAAGIPDFRTPGTGLYDNLQKYNLPYPEAVFDVEFYRRKPQPFLSLARELWPGLRHSPTLTHSFVATLEKHGKLLRNYTQNIDGLEHLAGISEECLLECHGHFRSASCIRCGKAMDGEECKRIIMEGKEVPTCRKCKSPVKPDIVFFGEGLPDRFHKLLQRDVDKVDLLIVMGTSLQVAPVSMIPQYCRGAKRVLVNRENVGDFYNKKKDMVLLGDCDELVMQLCEELGWTEEVKALNKNTKVVPPEAEEEASNDGGTDNNNEAN